VPDGEQIRFTVHRDDGQIFAFFYAKGLVTLVEFDHVIGPIRCGDLPVFAREILSCDKDLLPELRPAELQFLSHCFVEPLA
jgi:hypothetical protein